MNIRPKTMRRLAILLAGCVVIAVVFWVLVHFQDKARHERLMAERAAGMAAFEQGDYAEALPKLSKYVAREKDDPQALFAYGKSRARVEELSGKHIMESMGVFKLLLTKPLPDELRLQCQHLLLETYDKVGAYNTEQIALADDVLAKRPDDLTALKYKAIALSRLLRYDEALAAARKRNELAPFDLDGQYQTLTLLTSLKKPKEEILAHAEALLKAHPDDPRFELLMGVAHRCLN